MSRAGQKTLASKAKGRPADQRGENTLVSWADEKKRQEQTWQKIQGRPFTALSLASIGCEIMMVRCHAMTHHLPHGGGGKGLPLLEFQPRYQAKSPVLNKLFVV